MSDPISASVTPPATPPVVDPANPGQTPESVSYETHRKLLSEKKRVQEERDALAAKDAERERKELEARGDFLKIIEIEKKRADEAEAKASSYEERTKTSKKVNALLKALDNSVPEKYLVMLPYEDLPIDPETGEVNQTAVAKAAEEFRKNYPELLIKPNGPRLPTEAPRGNGAGMITAEDYAKLPLDEMKKWKPHQLIYK